MTGPDSALPTAIITASPPDNSIRIGTVSALSPLTINVQGGSVENPGVLIPALDLAVGDTVALGRQDQSFVVLGSLIQGASSGRLGGASLSSTVATTTTSGTGVVVSNTFTQAFTKLFDSTDVEVHATFGGFVTVANTGMAVDLRLTGAGTATLSMLLFFNPANTHMYMSGHSIFSGLPAGAYTATFFWARSGGTGTLTCDGNDRQSYTVKEVL